MLRNTTVLCGYDAYLDTHKRWSNMLTYSISDQIHICTIFQNLKPRKTWETCNYLLCKMFPIFSSISDFLHVKTMTTWLRLYLVVMSLLQNIHIQSAVVATWALKSNLCCMHTCVVKLVTCVLAHDTGWENVCVLQRIV